MNLFFTAVIVNYIRENLHCTVTASSWMRLERVSNTTLLVWSSEKRADSAHHARIMNVKYLEDVREGDDDRAFLRRFDFPVLVV